MEVDRYLTVWSKVSNEIIKEIEINDYALIDLKNVIIAPKDDPLLYGAYMIDESNIEKLKALFKEIDIDFSRWDYSIDCYQKSTKDININ